MALSYKVNGGNTFTIDEVNSDDEYCYVDVAGLGTVIIKAQPDGICIDVYPSHVSDEPVASTWAHISDLTQEN